MAVRQKQTVRSKAPALQSVHFSRFDGVNNLQERTDIKPTELAGAVNFDIDRDGYLWTAGEYTQLASGAGYHSVDASGLFVQSGNLMQITNLNPFSASLVRLGVGDRPMSYAAHNGATYYTNGAVIGYIQGGQSYGFDAPAEKYKAMPMPGQVISYFNGRLYVGRGSQIWITDALAFNSVDMRTGFKQFTSNILMLAPLDDGMFVFTEDRIYWMGGMGPESMTLREVSTVPALPGSFAYVDNRLFGKRINEKMMGKIIVFYLNNGDVCWGTDEGIFGNITARKYRGPIGARGAAVFISGTINKYLCSIT